MEGVLGFGGIPKFWRDPRLERNPCILELNCNVFAGIPDLEGSQELGVDSMVFVGFHG